MKNSQSLAENISLNEEKGLYKDLQERRMVQKHPRAWTVQSNRITYSPFHNLFFFRTY
jgi:hypothetical protein